MRGVGLRARLRGWVGLDDPPVNGLAPDRFDEALKVIAARHAELRLTAQTLRHDSGDLDAANATDDAADEVCTLLILVIADALGRGMRADRAQARAVESADFLMDAACYKLAGQVSV